jgi:hypothetical protein
LAIAIDVAIRAGKMSFLDGVDKRQSNFYRRYQSHPQLAALVHNWQRSKQLNCGSVNEMVITVS